MPSIHGTNCKQKNYNATGRHCCRPERMVNDYENRYVDNDGVRIDWLNVNAGSENAAVSKARVIAARGCYKDQIDSIKAVENGIDYTYKPI